MKTEIDDQIDELLDKLSKIEGLDAMATSYIQFAIPHCTQNIINNLKENNTLDLNYVCEQIVSCIEAGMRVSKDGEKRMHILDNILVNVVNNIVSTCMATLMVTAVADVITNNDNLDKDAQLQLADSIRKALDNHKNNVARMQIEKTLEVYRSLMSQIDDAIPDINNVKTKQTH